MKNYLWLILGIIIITLIVFCYVKNENRISLLEGSVSQLNSRPTVINHYYETQIKIEKVEGNNTIGDNNKVENKA